MKSYTFFIKVLNRSMNYINQFKKTEKQLRFFNFIYLELALCKARLKFNY